jgi:hypothetical protein
MNWEMTQGYGGRQFGCRPPGFALSGESLCLKFLSQELLGFGYLSVPLAELVRS